MRRVRLIVWVLGALMCLASCEEKDTEPEMVLKKALEALDREDYDTYLRCVDMGVEMDSAQVASMRKVLRQHVGWRKKTRATLVSIDLIDKQMHSDSVCTLYYQYSFADGVCEVASQKMVRQGEKWKLRLRN